MRVSRTWDSSSILDSRWLKMEGSRRLDWVDMLAVDGIVGEKCECEVR